MTELARRHHVQWEIGIEQFHPGASIAGAFSMSFRDKENARLIRQVSFSVGGKSGTWSVQLDGTTDGDLSDALLPEPARVIDLIERSAGLPPGQVPLPASCQQVLGISLTACLLEALVFWRGGWRASLGCYGYNGGIAAADWATWLGVELEDQASKQDPSAQNRLNQCVLLHSSEDGGPNTQQKLITGNALTIDLRTGLLGTINSAGWEKSLQLAGTSGFTGGSIRHVAGDLMRKLGSG